MTDAERDACRTLLGVPPDVTRAGLERAFLSRNLALVQARNNASDAERPAFETRLTELRAAFAALHADLDEQERAAARPGIAAPASAAAASSHSAAIPSDAAVPAADGEGPALLAFGHWKVNTFVPPLLLAAVWVLHQTPLTFFLRGFHVWVHELGHAVPAWLCGRWALPIPFGWTAILPDYSPVVHWGLLLLLGLLFVAGWRERKIWPMVAAVALAGLQHIMTWHLPPHWQEFWFGGFGGVAGEFVLSTLFMMAFFVQLPEPFRWGACRYVVFLIGATTFLAIWSRWLDVYRGLEEIPFGSLIAGEDDTGGDMNRLRDAYGWSKFKIRRTYYLLGQACWLALGLTWAVFALRLNALVDLLVTRRSARGDAGPA